jgi:putative ATP-binding cassette transporter
MTSIVIALRTFLRLALPYFRSEDRWFAFLLLAGIVAAELGLVAVLVSLNEWNKRFFNALEIRDWGAVQAELLVFCAIAAGAVVAGMSQYRFGQKMVIRWRQWMTERFVAQWMIDGRHYRLRLMDDTVDNIHLRIANDTLIFLTRTHELFTWLIGSLVTIASFAVILWALSASTPLPLFGMDFAFAGYLIWLAILCAAVGTFFTHMIGRPLIPLNFRQQRFEADFRFALARVTDQSEPVALMGGETIERKELRQRFQRLVNNWTQIVYRQTHLVGFVAGYARFSMVLPTLIVTPAYLSGAITLGTLMQAALAFQQMEGAFGVWIGAYSKVAEWKAVMDRIAQFEVAMGNIDSFQHPAANIAVNPGGGTRMTISDLTPRLPSGQAILHLPKLELAPGDRLLVAGPSGAGKSTLFRAVNKLWPLGEGTIHLPQGARVLTMPQRPYFPLGSLRQAIAYPNPAEEIGDAATATALAATGLKHLIPRLDEEADWQTTLSGGEQQRVVFARALLTRPEVLLLDDPVSALEEADARDLFDVLREWLPKAIIVSIGRAAALGQFHDRVVELRSSGTHAAPAERQRASIKDPEKQNAEDELLD